MAALTDPDRALALVVEHSPKPVSSKKAIGDALGEILVAPLVAAIAQPPFSKSMMDGYAVKAGDAGRTVNCNGEVAAGSAPTKAVEAGTCQAIMTGAPCPDGAEAVVKIEDAPRDGDDVTLPESIRAGQHIQPEAFLCAAGDEILPAGAVLSSVAVASAAAVGCATVDVAVAPTVAIITTGNELAQPGDSIGPAQIYDSNSTMMVAQARLAGAGRSVRLHARDEDEALHSVLEEAREYDIVVLSGGVSMGRYDLVPKIVAELDAEVIFHKVAQKPGKPILFARRGQQLIFGLPGTPLGSHLGFHRYVGAAIRVRLGRPAERPRFQGRLTTPIKTVGSRALFRVARAVPADGGWAVEPLNWGGSSDLIGPALANCYLRFDPGEHQVAEGEKVWFEVVDGAAAGLGGEMVALPEA